MKEQRHLTKMDDRGAGTVNGVDLVDQGLGSDHRIRYPFITSQQCTRVIQ
jgi:hypothetical protein